MHLEDLIICDEPQTVLPAYLFHALSRYGHGHPLPAYMHQPGDEIRLENVEQNKYR